MFDGNGTVWLKSYQIVINDGEYHETQLNNERNNKIFRSVAINSQVTTKV